MTETQHISSLKNCDIFNSGRSREPEKFDSVTQCLMLSDWLLTSALKLFGQVCVKCTQDLLFLPNAIPKFFIRFLSVLGFIPSRAAAPSGPLTLPFVLDNTRRICRESTSSIVSVSSLCSRNSKVFLGCFKLRCSNVSGPEGLRMRARSITFLQLTDITRPVIFNKRVNCAGGQRRNSG